MRLFFSIGQELERFSGLPISDLSWSYFGRIVVVGNLYISSPLYVYVFGISDYWLFALAILLFAALSGIDQGVLQVVTRHVAGNAHEPRHEARTNKFLWFVRGAYFVLVCSLAAGINKILPLFLNDNTQGQLSDSLDTPEVIFFGVLVRWLSMVYRAELIGRQKHEAVSKIESTTIFFAFMAPLLWSSVSLVQITIHSYFLFQGFMWCIQLLIFFILAGPWKYQQGTVNALGHYEQTPHSRELVLALTLSLSQLIISNADKLLVIRNFTELDFSVYSIAGTYASALLTLITPLTLVLAPKLANASSERREQEVSELVVKSIRFSTLVSGILGVGLALIIAPALSIWSGIENIDENYIHTAAILVVAMYFSSCSYVSTVTHYALGYLLPLLVISVCTVLAYFIFIITIYERLTLEMLSFAWLFANFFFNFLIVLSVFRLHLISKKDIIFLLRRQAFFAIALCSSLILGTQIVPLMYGTNIIKLFVLSAGYAALVVFAFVFNQLGKRKVGEV